MKYSELKRKILILRDWDLHKVVGINRWHMDKYTFHNGVRLSVRRAFSSNELIWFQGELEELLQYHHNDMEYQLMREIRQRETKL